MPNRGFVRKEEDGRDAASGPKRLSKKAADQGRADHREKYPQYLGGHV